MTLQQRTELAQAAAAAIKRGWIKPGKPYTNPNYDSRKQALKQKRVRFCDCQKPAIKRDRGGWVCERCATIEKDLHEYGLQDGRQPQPTTT